MIRVLVFLLAVVALTKPVGTYMARVFSGERTWLDPVMRPVEDRIYRLCGVASSLEMTWTQYAAAVVVFNVVGVAVLYALLRLQGVLPGNPAANSGQSPALAFNTAMSFVTNTNWQAYAGETGVTYLTQMVGLTWQNFVSAATGLGVALAFIRGLTRASARTLGNFWVDLVRGTLWVLLPLSFVLALLLASQGVVQNLAPYRQVRTLEGATQTIAQGPVASQEAIKELGVNGGGFFNANSAHPYENPSPLTNFLEMTAILVIPAGLTYTFGRFARDQRQGWAVFAAMTVLLVLSFSGIYAAEQAGNPILARAGTDQVASPLQAGGNMEGKEVRFGVLDTALFGTVTTSASCGSVNGMHDSFTPLGGGIAMLNIALGELIFGGVGVGLAGMLVFALLAVFIAGLMVGRTPEYLGKKIGAREIQLAMLAVLVIAATTLVGSAVASVLPAALSSRANVGPHGLTEILYAFTSASGNNGSAFAGLAANTTFYNIALAVAMFLGRFFFIIPVLGIAGSLAAKPTVPASAGTFPTRGALFVGLLVGTVLIVGALTYFPAYALGPVVEHLLMAAGKVF